MAQKPASKRRYERFDCPEIAVEAYRHGLLSLLGRKNIGLRLVNMSECGVQFVVKERLEKMMKLSITVPIPRVPDKIEGEVVVHWCVANGKRVGEFLVGAEFVKVPDGTHAKIQLLRKYVRSPEFRQKAVGSWQNPTASGPSAPSAPSVPPSVPPAARGDGITFIDNPRT